MYDVGQVLYAILTKKQRIIPMRVVEQVVRRSMGGETIQYLVQVPGKSGLVDLSSLGKDIYSTLEDVREKLRHNVWKAVDDMVHKAQLIAEEEFGQQVPPSVDSELTIPSNGSNNLHITLDNGQRANLHLDTEMLSTMEHSPIPDNS